MAHTGLLCAYRRRVSHLFNIYIYRPLKKKSEFHSQTLPGTGMDCAAHQEEMTPLNLPRLRIYCSPRLRHHLPSHKHVAVTIPLGTCSPNRRRSTIDANSKYTFNL